MHDFRLIILMLVLVVTPQVAAAQSLTPREQLQQYVAELRRNPADDALREKIIKLAQELKPSPAIPEEARRHYVRADALRSDAKSPHDADAAAEEYQQALLEAPWWPDAYRDLGVALEVATRYEEAKKALNLYLLCHPSEDEARKAQDEIYRIEAKEEEAQVAQARTREEEARAATETAKRRSLEGTWTDGTWDNGKKRCPGIHPTARFSIARSAGGADFVVKQSSPILELHLDPYSFCGNAAMCVLRTQSIAGNNVQFVTSDDRSIWVHKYNLTLSADGTTLSGPHEYYFKGENSSSPYDSDIYCRLE